MNSTEQQLSALEREIKEARVHADLGEALINLRSNRDFNKLITDGFLKEQAVRLVHLKADPNMQAPHQQAAIVRDIDAIGVLAEYFNMVRIQAANAVKQITDAEETRAELLAEEAE